MDFLSLGGALLGGLASSGSKSTGSQTQTKDPWGPAQDWLKQNIASGQNLQNWYQQNPMSAQQQAAYGNQFGLSDMSRQMLPGLLASMGGTKGFDRSNPAQRPSAYQFSPGLLQGQSQVGGLLSNAYVPPAAPAAPVKKPVSMDDLNSIPMQQWWGGA